MSSQRFSDAPSFLKDFLYYMLTIKGLSPKTVEAYYIDLRGFLRYLKAIKDNTKIIDIKDIDISDMDKSYLEKFTLSDAYEYLTYMMEEHNNRASARARKVSSLRSFFKYLTTKSHILSENPIKELEVPSLKKGMPKYLSLEESLELLSVANNGLNLRDYCILVFFLNCGMRLSELVGINLTDIKGNSLTLLGKGNKERIVFLNNACILAYENYFAERKLIKAKPGSENALFLSKQGKRISGRRVEQIVKDYFEKAGINSEGYSPHKLRHTAATLMYQHGGVDIRVLKEVLGHVSIATTEIYTHVANKQVEAAIDSSPLANIKAKKQKKIEY